MRIYEIENPDAGLELVLSTEIDRANSQQQPSKLSWAAFNSRMQNIDNVQFDYYTFKKSYDTNPSIKKYVKKFDRYGLELNTEVEAPNKEQPEQPGEVDKMAKAAAAQRVG
jgi:hypothetical protein